MGHVTKHSPNLQLVQGTITCAKHDTVSGIGECAGKLSQLRFDAVRVAMLSLHWQGSEVMPNFGQV